jgi:glycosyltransferase involved in cell wall biosynthesis
MDPVRVSVIVPVYNTEKYLRQCLDSLVGQTLTDMEIIVVNDGSSDGSLALAREYERRHSNIHVIDQANQGLSAARNAGMKRARGEYVGFLDSDDWASLDMFESLYHRAVQDASDLVIADTKVFFEDQNRVDVFWDRAVWAELPDRVKNAPFELKEEPRVLLLEPAAWKRLYKRDFLRQCKFEFPVGLIFEDIPAHFTLLLKAKAISLLDKPVCFYRTGRPGKITDRTDRTVFQMFDVFELVQECLRASQVGDRIWSLYLKVQMRCCSWLYNQVPSPQRREFLARWTTQYARVPRKAFALYERQFGGLRDRLLMQCVRKGWAAWFANVATQRITMPLKAYITLRYRPWRRIYEAVHRRAAAYRAAISRRLAANGSAASAGVARLENKVASLRRSLARELPSLRRRIAGLARAESSADVSCWRIKNAPQVITVEGQSACAVSVVVPVYNVERCLPQCIESLIHQTLDDMQIILVNDGSKDRSLEIIKDYARRHPRILCIDKPNGGCASARNAGMRAARGEYVGFVDSDDWVDASMFKKLHDKAVQCNADIVQCGLVKYYERENRYDPVNEDRLASLVERAGNRMDRVRDLLCLQPTMWRRIYRRSMLQENNIAFPQDVRMFDDLPFQFMALACCRTIAIVNEPLYYYRLQRAGQDVGVTDQRLFVTFRLFEILKDFIARRNDVEIQPYFDKLQLASHAWILQQIDLPWKEDYLTKAASCLEEGPMEQLRSVARAA